MIHKDVQSLEGSVFERRAARGIILRGSDILLLYTRRYNDYSFPGGGLEPDEDLFAGLRREMYEETGATQVEIVHELGYIEEYLPYYKPEFDMLHMISYYFVCRIEEELGETRLEDYEINNGMSAVWVNIHEAIHHNRQVIESREASMGLAVERETFVLEKVARELLSTPA
ncbi:NUDIX domain-containing protein [Paenibacillus sp. sgz500958]|uniref:NUDIX domain-containing protein n=1 Tax=Paenibacillus sp. sgz500958 TaxID=3242475 RepID=UPI0036D282DF